MNVRLTGATRALVAFCGCVLAGSASARGQAAPVVPAPPILFVQRGQSADALIDGQFLGSVNSLLFSSDRGLSASIVEPEKNAPRPANQVVVRLTADADAPLGDRELRLVNPQGVSPPIRLTIGQYPRFEEKEPNNTPEQAQDISFPVTLMGKIDGAGDVDCFRFVATKAQPLVFDVHAMRSRSSLDPVLTIVNDAGREMATRLDLHGGDPVVVFEAPADGKYVAIIRDLQYRGGADFTYRIDAGAIPYVQAIAPMSVPAGKISEIKPIGVNVGGPISVDLTYATADSITVRARSAALLSNPMNVDVGELPAFVDDKPGATAQAAVMVPFPIVVTGRLLAADVDENFYKFHVAQKQSVTIEARARAMGSPIDALISLRDVNGNVMQRADASNNVDPSIVRDLDPGDYLVSIRDLFFKKGPRYAYELRLRPGAIATAAAPAGDFSIRFLPDAPRLSRGGRAAVFVDVQRQGNFAGDITVSAEDLPPGVSCPPLVVNDKLPGASGMLILSAAGDARLGSYPLRIRASAVGAASMLSRLGVPMYQGRPIDLACLTVLEAAPFNLEPATTLTPERIAQLSAESDALAAKLAAPNPQLAAAQAEWEKKNVAAPTWTVLSDATITATDGTQFQKLEDGSFLATAVSPDHDTYTLIAKTNIAGITAVRLEALTDPSLPSKGPGRSTSNGNFVLSNFKLSVAPASAPDKAKPVTFHDPIADFSQDGYGVADALKPQQGKGWASHPRTGVNNQAIFPTSEAVGDAQGAILTFTLDQQYGQQHTLGHIRISVTNSAGPSTKSKLPDAVARILPIPEDKRSPEEKSQVAAYYRTIDPQVAADIARLDGLRAMIGKRLELARLETAMKTDTPELIAEREAWEKMVNAGATWLPLDITGSKSDSGATLTRQPDDSILVEGVNPNSDVYTLTAATSLEKITAIRIEALPDASLAGGGPGRAPSGNFVLARVLAWASPKDAAAMAPPVEWSAARATFEQQGYPAESLVTGSGAGWGIAPSVGKPAVLTLRAKAPFGIAGGSALSIVLEQPRGDHQTLGHFRLWATSSDDPANAVTLPPQVIAIFKTPADKRNDQQKAELASYFRAIAPALEPLRRRLDEVKSRVDADEAAARGQKLALPFLLNRNGYNGEARITLDGFVTQRDPGSAAPASIASAFKFEPLVLPPGVSAGTLNVTVEGGAPVGSRYISLRAEAKTDPDTRIEYSAPFVLTVREK